MVIWISLYLLLLIITGQISIGMLELIKDEIVKRAASLGYKLDKSNENNIINLWTNKNNKTSNLLLYIPIVNIIAVLKNSNDEKIKELIEKNINKKILIQMTEEERDAYRQDGIKALKSIQEGLIKSKSVEEEQVVSIKQTNYSKKESPLYCKRNTSLGLAIELKSKIEEIMSLEISKEEKSSKIIELLQDYDLMPKEDSKTKKLI